VTLAATRGDEKLLAFFVLQLAVSNGFALLSYYISGSNVRFCDNTLFFVSSRR
jgi:hypothetical protein